MTSTTPASSPGPQSPSTSARAASGTQKPQPAAAPPHPRTGRWWQRWLEPIVSVTIIISLLAALVTGAVAVFQSVKSDINAAENRVHEEIRSSEARQSKRTDELKADLKHDNADLKAELSSKIDASEARQSKRTDELKADLKQDIADLKDVNSKLDLMLEATIPNKT